MVHRNGTANRKKANNEGSEEVLGADATSQRPWPLVVAGVATSAALGLTAASLIGVGPVAIAGTAGYLAYRKLTSKSETGSLVEAPSKSRARAA